MGKKRVFTCGPHKKVVRIGPLNKSTFKCDYCKLSAYRDANLLSERKCIPKS